MNDSDESAARAALDEASAAIVAGVERTLPTWVEQQVVVILDAWGKADDATRTRAIEDARSAGVTTTARISNELRALFALDPAEQRATPLEIVRTAVREPTRILEEAGVPPVVRDQFEERSFPDDRYGLVPHTLSDLGDETLGPQLLAWGLAKAKILRSRVGG